MEPRAFKDDVFAHVARMGATLGHAKRVEIIDVLSQGQRSVESLASEVSASVANTSRHLQILAAAGLVSRRVEGTARIYRLTDDGVEVAYRTLVTLAHDHISELNAITQNFFANADGQHALTIEEFKELDRAGDVVLVDVRPSSEFMAGHVEGAVNIPVAELAQRLSDLPQNSNIIAYCRGPFCVMAADAVTRLRAQGFTAQRLDANVFEWRESGGRVEVGP